MRVLALPLLVALVLADDQNRSVAADDLALLAHRLDRRSYLHDPFRRLGSGGSALAAVVAAATKSWIRSRARVQPRVRAGLWMVATPGAWVRAGGIETLVQQARAPAKQIGRAH